MDSHAARFRRRAPSNRSVFLAIAWATMLALGQMGAAHARDGNAPLSAMQALDEADPRVGTAPLDRQALIGNAPPPGEPLYSGMTSPGASLPHGTTEATQVNLNVDLSYPAGVGMSYYYPRTTMIGFTGGGSSYGGGASPMVMRLVRDWTMPSDYAQSYYDKACEKASPGYYAVDLATFHTRVELTATRQTCLMRFTFPASHRSNVIINLRRPGGAV